MAATALICLQGGYMAKIFFMAVALFVLIRHGPCAQASQSLKGGFSSPTGALVLPDGILITEWGAGNIKKLVNGKAVTLLSGLSAPAGITRDDRGNIYFAGYGDGIVHIWDGKGKPRTFATGFSAPTGLFWSKDKGLLVANRNAGEIISLDGTGKKSLLSSGHATPVGIAQTADGHLFISCYGGSVDILAPDSSRSKVTRDLATPGVGITPADAASVYVVDYGKGNIVQVFADGTTQIIASGLPSPVALAMLPDGNLLAGCWSDGTLKQIKK